MPNRRSVLSFFYFSLFIVVLATMVIGHGPNRAEAQEIPRVLTLKDANLYAKIFELQHEMKWKAADKLIKQVNNKILMGHVLYMRYMHPTHYRSTYPELHMWMKSYADHPNSDRLYRLAITRHLSDWKATPRPKNTSYLGGTGPGQPFHYSRSYKSKRKRSAQDRNNVAHAQRVVRRYLYRGQPTNASEYLNQKNVSRLLDKVEYAQLAEKIAQSFFLYGKDAEAIEYAEKSLQRTTYYAPMAHWTAGLAAWREERLEKAANHFVALSKAKNITDWIKSRANWWASRAFLKLGQPEKTNEHLIAAAKYPRTFYGLLALRQLGVRKPFEWDLPELKDKDIDRLMKMPAIKRAKALSEAAQYHLAERELRSAFPASKTQTALQLLSLAERIGAPSVAMRMGIYLWEHKDSPWDAAIYPLPQWHPHGGFKVDRALLFAFMRQESGFYSRAESPAGAKGLMQLMPRTASYIAKDSSLRNRKNRKLFNPSFNLELGQKYLQYLMRDDAVSNNLFYLTIAYNGGPGNLIKWKKRAKGSEDPLFFIEAMQSRETRQFIKRVLTNFWIYRHRLGQELPALDDIAEGRWPEYHPLDSKSKDNKVATNARN
ncbi:transglycosylase SLT domain-containing protein [Sneathiella limimaris]|uniref:transglycosylase SLT domain-containing protein n=1 Tax=Sneathiella limimaris TaxID=1964213 RepID=UPI00146CC75A